MKYTKLDPNSLASIMKLSTQLCTLKEAFNNEASKMNRIQGASNYSRAFTYHGTGTENVITIIHTGTTALGVESITETFTYVDPAVNGSNVTNIAYS